MSKSASSRRRFFLKGLGAAGVVLAAPGGGMFVGAAAAPQRIQRADVREEPGVQEDADAKPLADGLWMACVQASYDVFNASAEAIVKGNESSADLAGQMGRHGLRAMSPEARSANQVIPIPGSIQKLRTAALKQKGWHNHAYTTTGVWPLTTSVHWNVTW